MKHFWKGFESSKTAAPVRFKKHVIVLFWNEEPRGVKAKEVFSKISKRYPSVAIKTINVRQDPTKPLRHNIHSLPMVLLLKDGREVGRVLADDGTTLLEKLFRKATT